MKPSRNYRVLLLEDEAGDAGLMRLAFGKAGYTVEIQHVADGREALNVLNRSDMLPPDLILADLKMPGMGGLEFLAALKKQARLRSIPVVVVSSSALDSDVNMAYRLGASGYLLKTVDINEFFAVISRLADYWFSLVALPDEQT